MRTPFSVLIAMLMLSPSVASSQEFLDGWSKRQLITIQASQVDADLTDFTVYVNLGAADFSTLRSEASSTEIAITSSDGVTKLNRELVTLTGSIGELYFKGPSVDGDTDTGFYIYWSNPLANESNSTSTWDADFIAVFHFEQDPSSGSLTNSVSGGVGNLTVSNMEAGDRVAGKIGNGWSFDGSNEAAVSGALSITTQTWTHSFWLNTSATTTDEGLLSFTTSRALLAGASASVRYFDGSYRLCVNSPVFDGAWRHVTVRAPSGASQQTGYKNGTADQTDTYTAHNITSFRVAERWDGGGDWLGTMDEVRVSKVVRSVAWVTASYRNQNTPATFYTVGVVENAPVNSDLSAPVGFGVDGVFKGSRFGGD